MSAGSCLGFLLTLRAGLFACCCDIFLWSSFDQFAALARTRLGPGAVEHEKGVILETSDGRVQTGFEPEALFGLECLAVGGREGNKALFAGEVHPGQLVDGDRVADQQRVANTDRFSPVEAPAIGGDPVVGFDSPVAPTACTISEADVEMKPPIHADDHRVGIRDPLEFQPHIRIELEPFAVASSGGEDEGHALGLFLTAAVIGAD
ncbi:MAG TPA: hypothetical protein PLS82_13575 [Phycisphaerae bacterium]|nr:hypothetical protein [Phycisphaerae bacterium]